MTPTMLLSFWHLVAFGRRLKMSPRRPEVARALDQCERLELAIKQFHAEGLRFAAHTLVHMVLNQGHGFYPPCPCGDT